MSAPIDERVVSNIRAAWEADPAAHKILLDAHEIETLLAVCAERDRLKREQTWTPGDGLFITREALRDAEPEALLGVVRQAIANA